MAQAKTKPKAASKPVSDPATTFSPSGAPNQTGSEIDPAHAAVDADPRENTTEDQNRIDFNDPTISGQEAVERNLEEQGE